MSETSETKELLRLAINTIEGLAGQQAMADDWYQEPLAKLNAALNQPVPSGALTDEERAAIERYLSVIENTVPRAKKLMREDVLEDLADDSTALKSLLARSAQQGETVTVRREVLEDLLDLFRGTTYQLSKCDVGMGEDWEDRRERTVAEAEAALAEGGK